MTETETKWSERVREWRASGRTAEQFAQGQGFEASTLRYWASRLKAKAETPMAAERAADKAGRSSPVRMVRVRRARAGARDTRRSSAIAITVGGARIEVQAGFDRDLLGEVIDALGGGR